MGQPRSSDGAPSARRELAALLQLAHSGELAAAHAYRGHARSVASLQERDRILEIEEEEWRHRRQVRSMLAGLGSEPQRWRELRAAVIGRALGLACHLAGYLAPMYGAGRLESRNVREYESAARLAFACGRTEWIECLLAMAELEWEHERYFRDRVERHRWGRKLPLWPAPPPKDEIRLSFARQTGWIGPRAAGEAV